MKQKIKSISIDASLNSRETVSTYVSFSRWERWAESRHGHKMTKFSTKLFCHPTPASIARCRRAQDKMAGSQVEIFGELELPSDTNQGEIEERESETEDRIDQYYQIHI